MSDEMIDYAAPRQERMSLQHAKTLDEHHRMGPQPADTSITVAIAATFTVDPLQRPLQFWITTLEMSAEVVLAPYAQIMQELLSTDSLLARNKTGFDLLLIRLEDWIRDRLDEGIEQNIEHLYASANSLRSAFGTLHSRTSASMLVFFCPPSSTLTTIYKEPIAEINQQLMSSLTAMERVHCWGHADLEELYPTGEYEDPRSDRIGHIPYTDEYFVAIATLLARRITVLSKPQRKVIAIDCDNTLWKGICGEDGPLGIELTSAHLALQSMLIRQHDAGMLLCLCSKNNESDVAAVFARPDMLLRDRHVVASRVNWDPKSANLLSLAQELDLAIESFILIDDSPLECAEVGRHCAGVLTLQVPAEESNIAHFLKHTWAFDRVEITEEARQRTEQYRQNRARSQALEQTGDLQEFLASLRLQIKVAPMQAQQLPRVAELVQRTNQFNLTGVRRRASEIEMLWSAGDLQILVVNVRDRFGDYGLVGAVFYRTGAAMLEVDTFVLSCRALGRGVENRIVTELAQIARLQAVETIELRYRPSPRNAPARDFLERTFARFRTAADQPIGSGSESLFIVPVEYASSLNAHSPVAHSKTEGVEKNLSKRAAVPVSAKWHESAYSLSRLPDIVAAIDRSGRRESGTDREYLPPRTQMEAAVAQAWGEVLAVPQVSVRADFFELGGDSLLAVRAIARVGYKLGLELPIYDFFAGSTVEQVAAKLAGITQVNSRIERAVGDRALLSWAQQRLWFIDQLEGGSAAYHIPVAIRLLGELELSALQAALDAVVQRHEVLRTVFIKVAGEPEQQIAREGHFELQCVDLQSTTDREAQVLNQSREELLAPFDLSTGPLIRGRLLRLSQDEHVLLITMHHIVSDGWSIGILISELAALYESRREGRPSPLAELPIQYADYAQWQRQWMTAAQLQQQLGYWKEHLQGAPQLLELPTDRPRPAVQSYRGASLSVMLEADLTAELKALSRRMNLTLAMTLYTAWSVLLARLSGQQDIVLGMPVANRRRTELEGLIGLFVNTLAVRVQLEDDPTVADLLERVKRIMLAAYAHQDVPFEQVVEALQPARSLSHSPIFQVMFVLHNLPRAVTQLSGLTLIEEQVPLQTAQFDLSLSLQESAEGILGRLNYASDLFEAATIERWLGYFKTLLCGFVRHSNSAVSRLALMEEKERRQIIEQFNSTHLAYPKDRLIHELFEQQVERNPHALALMYEEQSLTYAELNARANQLARYLRGEGVGPDQLVGICVERSVEMVIGLLGILKAGGAYVPLDPSYPPERIAYMLQDAAPRVLLTQARLTATLPHSTAKVIELDAGWNEIAQQPTSNLDHAALHLHSQQLAYVIYTSGSTGRPKGVMIEHRHVLNLWRGLEHFYDRAGGCERVTLNASIVFDASVQQLTQLLSGRSLFVLSQEVRRDASQLLDYFREHRIAGADCTPSQLRSWIAGGLLENKAPALRVVLVGGEPIDRELWTTLAGCAAIKFVNVYGPTECTVDATAAPLDGATTGPHIGHPMSNRRVYILDRHEQPAPMGVKGEIHIAGAGLARGYLNRAELTAQRFVPDPFSVDTRARMYKTGDLGCWHSDGTIEYLGRNDHQVKIRGFRLELGEIEAQLLRHPQVHEAVVLAREDAAGEKRLVAYVTCHCQPEAGTPAVEALRAHLIKQLPEYMVPSAFVVLPRFPLTPNGKLDRAALPAPELSAYASKEYEAPQGEVEEILAGIWQSLLCLERVGRHDNFFELGGHSLLIVQMRERLRRLGLSVELRWVFERPTLSGLASALSQGAVEHFQVPDNQILPGCQVITPDMLPLIALTSEQIEAIGKTVPGGATNVQDIYPLAPLQEGILFHHLLSNDSGDTYLVPTVLVVSSRARVGQLIAALQAVVDRHDVLRTAVLWEELPTPVQVVYRRANISVTELAFDRDREPMQQVEEWLKPELQWLDLRQAPLMRLKVAGDERSGEWFVLLQYHHIIGDYTSREILISEVVAHMEGRAQTLPLPIPYRQHVAQALAYARTHDAEVFFRSKLADVEETTAPFGLLDAHSGGSQNKEVQRQIETAWSKRVRLQARRFGVSAATMFHAAWSLVVAHTSGREDVVFGSVLLGRLQSDAGAQRVFGMFINTLPLRLKLTGLSAKQLVEVTQRELMELLSHEQSSLATAQSCSGVGGAAPLFTALFNYRHSAAHSKTDWSNASDVRAITGQNRTNYPITASVDDMGEDFSLTIQTDRRVDPARVAQYLHAAVQALVQALEQAPNTEALSLSILPQDERRQVLDLFNATRTEYPQDVSTHERFELQVKRTPNAIAVVYQQLSLTYAELNARVNQLAWQLCGQGVSAGDYVPILMSRSLQMLIAEIAVLKCGAVYVPMSLDLPIERMMFIISDCAAQRVVIDGGRPDNLDVEVEWIDCASPSAALERHSTDNLNVRIGPHSAAYVMYTSGSTGLPKGVVVPHRALNRLAINNGYAQITASDCLVHYSNPAFDASTFEIWGALLNGARLVILPHSVVLEGVQFARTLKEQKVTVLWITVGLFNRYIEVLADVFVRLRYVLVGGDSLEPGAIRRVLRNSPPKHLLNAYGPTECTTFSTTYPIEAVDEHATSIPIGRPMANAKIYILNQQFQPVPIGAAGELYIGGAGVALGYLNRVELTAQRFIADPFSSDPGARLYRTGDLGRWRADGAIEFLGRNDRQVKIRGFRIELEEIEAQLAQHPAVKEAIVLARQENGEKRLVAYTVPIDAALAPTVEQLRLHLIAALPEYMVPSAFVLLGALPLTGNGKVDRRALPTPELDAYANRTYEAPEGDAEAQLAQIFEHTLAVQRVGRQDNFFELGGHSLLALKALVRINQTLHADLRVTDLYVSPTVRDLAMSLRGARTQAEFVDLSREAVLDEDILAHPGPLRIVPEAILLTGATGFVGRFLLAQLLKDTDATIYCIVRATSPRGASERVKATLVKWNLWRDEFEQRIVGLAGDLRLPRLGLDGRTFDSVARTVDSIYHCATSMNHLETYAMAKAANVGATKELLRLTTQYRPKLINYVSTLSVFSACTQDAARVVTESTPIDQERHVTSNGYAASKWVGEKIFMLAQSRGIACNIFRLGFVWADTRLGRYDELQRGHRLLKSCLLSGFGIADFRHEMPPTPVDYAAQAIVHLASRHSRGGGIFHISSDRQMSKGVFERSNEIAGTRLKLLPMYEWVGKIKQLHEQGVDLPVVPLIEFAFGMDAPAFHDHERHILAATAKNQFDLVRTHQELEKAGIVAPCLGDELLVKCIERMFEGDGQFDDQDEEESSGAAYDAGQRIYFARGQHS